MFVKRHGLVGPFSRPNTAMCHDLVPFGPKSRAMVTIDRKIMTAMFLNKYIISNVIIPTVSSVPSLPSLIGRNGGRKRDVHLINTAISVRLITRMCILSLSLYQCPRLESLGCTKYLLRGLFFFFFFYFPISLFSRIELRYVVGNEASAITTAHRNCSSIDKCGTKGSRRFGGG